MCAADRARAEEGSSRDRFELAFVGTVFRGDMGNLRLIGHGVPLGGGPRTRFDHVGRAIGLRSPTFWGPELVLGYRRSYFALFLSGTAAKNGRADANSTDAQAATYAGSGVSEVAAYGGAIELYASLPLGPVTWSAGVAGGLRRYSVPLAGFAETACRGRSSSYACPETALSDVIAYVQPRLRFEIALGSSRVVFLGAYAGVDGRGARAAQGGLILSFGAPTHR